MAVQWLATDFGGPEVLQQVTVDLAPPGPGEVTIEVRAAGMNPADYKHFAAGQDRSLLPLTIGYEVAGVVAAIGPGTQLASGGGAAGDEVVAFQIMGGYASAVTARSADVFAKPAALSFPEAANLLLVGTTAAEMLHVTGVAGGDVVLLHGAAGAVGTSALQQARLLGATVVGIAGEDSFDAVRRYGGIPVRYGPGLEERVRAAAPEGVSVALDTVGSDEAIDVSLAVVPDRKRIVTIAAPGRAGADGIGWIGGSNPASGPYRASQRARLLGLAADGRIGVPIGQTFPLNEAQAAVAALMGRHPYGKLALVTRAG
ncbi:MAG TPA: NADP-dependent oxidoreductase [Streptosporangiaceae bacterium]|nr:NADP-dependent oxidoreductase [Streptosporangiaceae bacterium]